MPVLPCLGLVAVGLMAPRLELRSLVIGAAMVVLGVIVQRVVDR